MRLLVILSLLLASLSALAAPSERIACVGRGQGAVVYVEANLLSPVELGEVELGSFGLTPTRESYGAVRARGADFLPGSLAFPLRTGAVRTSLLLLPSERAGLLALWRATALELARGSAVDLYTFHLLHLTEVHGAQAVLELRCGPKRAGE